MPDPEPSHEISVIVDKPCWNKPISKWEALLKPPVREALREAMWTQPAEINILLSDNAMILELNKQYRGQAKPTNVLSFPSFGPDELSSLAKSKENPRPIILGDVVLAFETIQQEAIIQKKQFEHHLIHLVVHGILHLLGFDHENDKDAAVMESLEIKILSGLMIPNPYQES